MKTNFQKYACLLGGVLPFFILASGAGAAPLVTLAPIGPKPPGILRPGPITGYLEVYSATREYWNGDTLYNPHRRYSLYNAGGSLRRIVLNRSSRKEEMPEVVSLPAGRYYVLSESDLDGLVRVPVIIKGGRLTVVNLEPAKPSDPATREIQPARAVKAPSGQVVGWRAGS